MKHNKMIFCVLFLSVLFLTVTPLSALPVSFWLDVEGGAFFTGYNDVQIPSDTGTRLSLAEDLTPDDGIYYRLQAGMDLGRHSVFVLYAPLLVESSGSLDSEVDFYGETFAADSALTAAYKFNSYRLTYTYTFIQNSDFEVAAGLTGKIRDAYISLDDGTTTAIRENLGFVPLIHLSAEWFFAPHFSLLLRGDGLAAPQGRAEDFQVALLYTPHPKVTVRLGYRLLEGGADGGGSVYSFSMFHYASAGVRVRF